MRNVVGNLLLGAGFLVTIGSQLYLFVVTLSFVLDAFGVLGLVALFLFPPLWAVTPLVMWVATGVFPAMYFAAWLGGWIGGGLLIMLGFAIRGES